MLGLQDLHNIDLFERGYYALKACVSIQRSVAPAGEHRVPCISRTPRLRMLVLLLLPRCSAGAPLISRYMLVRRPPGRR